MNYSMHRKNVVITGANSGIGKVATIQFVSMGAIVIMTCRFFKRASKELLEIRQKAQNQKVELMTVDMSLLESIRSYATEYIKCYDHLDVLIHITALQRVDRSASAHGTVPLLGFLTPNVIDYAFRIPSEFKIKNGIEKWILRQSVADLLPEPILNRKKAKFWEGGGVEKRLCQYAENMISDSIFTDERKLPNGWEINSKEELLYYRIFKSHFGDLPDLTWMGRTKGAPIS